MQVHVHESLMGQQKMNKLPLYDNVDDVPLRPIVLNINAAT